MARFQGVELIALRAAERRNPLEMLQARQTLLLTFAAEFPARKNIRLGLLAGLTTYLLRPAPDAHQRAVEDAVRLNIAVIGGRIRVKCHDMQQQ